MNWKSGAFAAGWDPARLCECSEPKPVIVGGNGWYAVPLMCDRCRRVVPDEGRSPPPPP